MDLGNELSKTNLDTYKVFVNVLESPTLLMQAEPRQVVTSQQ